MGTNPYPATVTNELWRFWEEFKAHEPNVLLGGIFANKPGYHNSRKNNLSSNYSVRDSEDKTGPDDKAAAIDLTFPDAQRGDYRTIEKYCDRLMASSLDKDDPRLDVLREWYGQTDTDAEVEGYDCRYLAYVTSDPSHLWHIHISFDRWAVAHWPAMDAVLSVLRGERLYDWKMRTGRIQDPDMDALQDARLHATNNRVMEALIKGSDEYMDLPGERKPMRPWIVSEVKALRSAVETLAQNANQPLSAEDRNAIVSEVVATLPTAADIAKALITELRG